jgi:hypothetical protein
MALSFFCDKNRMPSDEQVLEVLGEAAIYWDGVNQFISEYGVVKEEWKIYSQKAGWCKKILLILDQQERNIVFLYPNKKCLTGVLVYGEKAVEAALNSDLPNDILNHILLAKAYKEGRSFQIEIREESDFVCLKNLITIKINN